MPGTPVITGRPSCALAPSGAKARHLCAVGSRGSYFEKAVEVSEHSDCVS
jgi:hypothetical protein